MGKYYCKPLNFTGVGYKDGVKQCEYMCYPMLVDQILESSGKKIIGPAMDLSLGDVCFGVEYHEQWINSKATFTNMPDSLGSFVIETGTIGAWWNYPSELQDAIKAAFGD